ncbi:hypothetical protein HK17_15655 [Acetobacter indonesiensis]|uniref:Uncharacterized protein n=1 Tax=Acetobacter indonesiensis TaxID=104101 RepID=A0A252AX10_9PROT|nr:hypothetical protein HK17_15655 [Acetobacter indonesiensis]
MKGGIHYLTIVDRWLTSQKRNYKIPRQNQGFSASKHLSRDIMKLKKIFNYNEIQRTRSRDIKRKKLSRQMPKEPFLTRLFMKKR